MSKKNLAVIEADSVIVSMRKASIALVEAKTIQQTKKILDVAAAAEIYARRQHLGEEAMDIALSIKVDALRKLGEMLQAAPKAKGELLRGAKSEPRENEAPTLAELGLTKKESAVAQKLAALPEEAFEQVRDGHVSVAKAIAAVDKAKKGPAAAETAQPTAATPIPAPVPGPVTVLTPAPPPQLETAPTAPLSPTPAPAPAGEVDWHAKHDELLEHSQAMAAILEAMSPEYDRMSAVIDADDHLKAAMERIKQLEALVTVMELRAGGLMAEKNEAIKAAKRWQRKAEGK
jgi:hypothetical protein